MNILRKYTDDFYRIRREQWESNHMVYKTLDESDPNLSFNQQAVKEGKSGDMLSRSGDPRDILYPPSRSSSLTQKPCTRKRPRNCRGSISTDICISRCWWRMTIR